mmetsp:Transcript_293/g.722  ORF Transcript_293/g.722 Transcript_293/m.722 type:complete len:351 (-) Transcript_293:1837-2889(-)
MVEKPVEDAVNDLSLGEDTGGEEASQKVSGGFDTDKLKALRGKKKGNKSEKPQACATSSKKPSSSTGKAKKGGRKWGRWGNMDDGEQLDYTNESERLENANVEKATGKSMMDEDEDEGDEEEEGEGEGTGREGVFVFCGGERMVGLADMSSVSRENIEVMDALIGNFTLYDDVNKVYDILKGHRKLSMLCEEKDASAKESIKQLQKQVEGLEREREDLVAQNEEEKRHENDKLKRQLAKAEAEAEAMEENIKELQVERDELKASLVQTEDKYMDRTKQLSEQEHRVKHELSLFAHISKINWTATDEVGGKNEIRGVISKTNQGDLNTFCFDTKKTSRFHIANKLWDAMDE